MWYRIFGTNAMQPDPAALVQHLNDAGFPVTGQAESDEQGWFRLRLVRGETHWDLERYLSTEEGVRDELNSWAAWLESLNSIKYAILMQRIIGTTQAFTLAAPDPADRAMCLRLSQYLARQTAGLIYVDGYGLCADDGTLLVPEA